MQPSVSHPSGGTAAETNTNTNTNSIMKDKENHQDSPAEAVTLKVAAARFGCAASSLKNNIKGNKLPALQNDPKAAFLVRPSEVERFLRATPAIASVFHPKTAEESSGTGESAQPPLEPAAEGRQHAIDQSRKTVEVETKGSPAVEAGAETSAPPAGASAFSLEGQGDSESRNTDEGRKRRRQRRRGRGNSGPREIRDDESLPVKRLVGISSKERLKIIACLNELAALVASA